MELENRRRSIKEKSWSHGYIMRTLDSHEKTSCGWILHRSAERGNASAEVTLGDGDARSGREQRDIGA